MTPRYSSYLCLLALFLLTDSTAGFTTRQTFGGAHGMSAQHKKQFKETFCQISSRRTSKLSVFIDPLLPADFKSEKKGDEKKKDPLAGFEVGSVVRVVAKDLKAYQVPPKAYGSFDSDKNFVPAPEGGDRLTQNLKIPVGLRGVVNKIYDDNEVSANFPIQVKFVPGEHVDEGFDTPVQFLAHFSPDEVEVV